MFFLQNGKHVVQISKELRALRAKEPPWSAQRSILRTSIMGYELGAIQQYACRSAAKNVHPDTKTGFEENAKLGMADLVTQCRMFCLDHYWAFDKIQKMGLDHLRERHEEIKVDGWAEK